MMRPARRGACTGTSRGVLVPEGVNTPIGVWINTPLRGVDKTLVTNLKFLLLAVTEISRESQNLKLGHVT